MAGAIINTLRQACRRLRDGTNATVAIEFAILSPLLFAILFGVVAFGTQYATRIALTYAAAEGGRAAVAGMAGSDRQALATSAISRTLTSLSPLVDATKAMQGLTFPAPAATGEFTISIAYSDDRFANLPFLPALNDIAPVEVSYLILDPSG